MDEQIKEVLWQMEHIRFVSLETGNYCLIVEDTELNDHVEDFLWDEYEYNATRVVMDTPASIPVYYNYLPSDLPAGRFLESLKLLDPVEVERIFRLNN